MSTATLLAENINSHVFNAVDGPHEHLTQALLDILTIRRRESGKAK